MFVFVRVCLCVCVCVCVCVGGGVLRKWLRFTCVVHVAIWTTGSMNSTKIYTDYLESFCSLYFPIAVLSLIF